MSICPIPEDLYKLENSKERDKILWAIILQKIIDCLEGLIVGGGGNNASCTTPTTDEAIARWDEMDCTLQDSLTNLDDVGHIRASHFHYRTSVPAGVTMNIIAGYAAYFSSGFLIDGEIIIDGDFLEV